MYQPNDSTTFEMADVPSPSPRGRAETCLVVIYGPGLGTKVPIEAGQVTIGRGSASDYVVPLKDVSRRHCRFTVGEAGLCVRDLGSTNGTSLNGNPLSPECDVVVASGDLVNLGGVIFKVLGGDDIEFRYHEEIYRTAIVDGLTQIHNRRYLTEFLEREMARAARYASPLALLLLDVDHFKSINDRFGHVAGDSVLRNLAGLIAPSIRRECCFARYGGEEFAIVMPETDLEHARAAAERVRERVSEHEFAVKGQKIELTVSVGVAVMDDAMRNPVDLFHRADENLYAAKHSGRDMVCG